MIHIVNMPPAIAFVAVKIFLILSVYWSNDMIDLYIIIVNYNVKEFLLNLLESLQKASKKLSTEIIVVDNNFK